MRVRELTVIDRLERWRERLIVLLVACRPRDEIVFDFEAPMILAVDLRSRTVITA